MISYKQVLKNPYYFFTNNTLFKISDYQDSDKCGKRLVTYLAMRDSGGNIKKQKVAPKGYYLDEHKMEKCNEGNSEISVTVYSTEMNHVECTKVFPYFSVTYDTVPGEGEEVERIVLYYYLQDMISVGDTFSSNKFVRNNLHTESGDTSYLDEFKNSIDDDIKHLASKGYSIDSIKESLPHWYFSSNNGQEFTVYGKKMKLVSVTGISQMNDSILNNMYEESVKNTLIKYGNELLSSSGKEISDLSITFV